MGEYQKSQNYYDEAVLLLEVNTFTPSFLNLNKVGVARVKAILQKEDLNLEALYDYYSTLSLRCFDGWMSRYIGEILLNLGDYNISEANHWIEKAIEADTKNETKLNLGKDYALYAEFFKRRGDRSKAGEKLGQAIDVLKECGADGWVEKYKKEMAAL
jgi:tetratricopeptide (TPR) repeat protein